MTAHVQVFGCRHDEAIHALRRPKSAKARNRGKWARAARRALWDLVAVRDLSAGGRRAQGRRRLWFPPQVRPTTLPPAACFSDHPQGSRK
jgi:hypothetical protein